MIKTDERVPAFKQIVVSADGAVYCLDGHGRVWIRAVNLANQCVGWVCLPNVVYKRDDE